MAAAAACHRIDVVAWCGGELRHSVEHSAELLNGVGIRLVTVYASK
jgi:hypothetical protein